MPKTFNTYEGRMDMLKELGPPDDTGKYKARPFYCLECECECEITTNNTGPIYHHCQSCDLWTQHKEIPHA